jgi:transposase InsO family protein
VAPTPELRSSGDLLADRRYAYAEAAMTDGDHTAAADLAEQSLELAPGFAPAHALLGRARAALSDRDGAVEALRRALAVRPAPAGMIHHSDRGVHYACADDRALLESHGVTSSMSRKGDCWDNAVSESFFATLEHELLADADFHTRREAHHAVAEFIDTWYNGERRHSTLGYVSPVQYEQQLRQVARAA